MAANVFAETFLGSHHDVSQADHSETLTTKNLLCRESINLKYKKEKDRKV